MKEKFYFLILTFTIFSCSTDDTTIIENKLTSDNIEIEYINLDFTLRDIAFLNENVGYVIDDNGGIFKTFNSGEEWIELYRSNKEFIDIYFLNTEIGFVLVKNENEYFLLKTRNGGASFEEVNIEEGSDLRKIYFIDSNTGFALGNHILKTVDNGENWTDLNLGFNVYMDMIKVNEAIYTCGLRGIFLKSENNGNDWNKIDLNANSHLYEIKPFENAFYLIGQSIIKKDLTSSKEFSIPAYIKSTHIYDEEIVIGFGEQYPEQGYFPKGAIFISNNSGKNWVTTIYNDFNRIRVVDFIDKSNGYGIADDVFNRKEYLVKIKIVNHTVYNN